MEAEVRVRWPQAEEFRFLEAEKDKDMDSLFHSHLRTLSHLPSGSISTNTLIFHKTHFGLLISIAITQ